MKAIPDFAFKFLRKEEDQMNNYKPGGGNKPQPYIPSGHGDKSGEYTNKPFSTFTPPLNTAGKFNFCSSSLVRKVTFTFSVKNFNDISLHHLPNSVFKKVINKRVISERYYNENGDVYLDIDYTDHKNPKTHPVVPHIHRWEKGFSGKFIHGHWEKFR